MRIIALAALALFSAPLASAQTAPRRPSMAAPAASASYETREGWCMRYAEWFISSTPADGPLPADVTPSHRFQVEFNYCLPDPQDYERLTVAELRRSGVLS